VPLRAFLETATELTPVPHDRPPSRDFRQRFDELERRRLALIEQLRSLGAGATAHPGYRNALTLLNKTFRKASVAQRVAVLEAAAWLIDLLEKLSIES
jgi:hypothetical protein